MDYKNKYLKYKNKYLQLKQLGGYKPDVNTLTEMENQSANGIFISHDLSLQNYKELQQFFNNVKDGKNLYLVPENFDNFMGVKDLNPKHLDKIWFRLSEKPSSYVKNVWKPLTLTNSIELDNSKIKKITIKKNVSIHQTIKEIYEKIKNLKELKNKDIDQEQLSGLNSLNEPFKINQKYKDEFLEIIKKYEGCY